MASCPPIIVQSLCCTTANDLRSSIFSFVSSTYVPTSLFNAYTQLQTLPWQNPVSQRTKQTLSNKGFDTRTENSFEEVSVSPQVLVGVTAKTKMPICLGWTHLIPQSDMSHVDPLHSLYSHTLPSILVQITTRSDPKAAFIPGRQEIGQKLSPFNLDQRSSRL
jgi:hypothetical protein